MRFMILLRATPDYEAGSPPEQGPLRSMREFTVQLVNAGVLLAGEGLMPSSAGARVTCSAAGRTVANGPFAEVGELIAGFWLVELKSMEEAVEWVKRIPSPPGTETEVEIRQVLEAGHFSIRLPQ